MMVQVSAGGVAADTGFHRNRASQAHKKVEEARQAAAEAQAGAEAGAGATGVETQGDFNVSTVREWFRGVHRSQPSTTQFLRSSSREVNKGGIWIGASTKNMADVKDIVEETDLQHKAPFYDIVYDDPEYHMVPHRMVRATQYSYLGSLLLLNTN